MSGTNWNTLGQLPTNGQPLILNASALNRIDRVESALFDFDGTLSLLREGWEEVMIPLMLEMICGRQPYSPAIQAEVYDYVERSTGILTIRQMDWLAEAVKRHGIADRVYSGKEYKALYLQRLSSHIAARQEDIRSGRVTADEMIVVGGRAFIESLRQRGITLYLASGTDHCFVVEESHLLGIDTYFNGGIYGALDTSEAHDKALLIQHILETNYLSGRELLVVGDGPVEIREAVRNGAVALGVASDEVKRQGWNLRKAKRLEQAGADLLIPDFRQAEMLTQYLCL